MTVYGAGGGGGPHNEDDNLKSEATAKILDLICEGTIQGLVDGAKSIYLNKTPIQAQDGTFNYNNVGWFFQTGSLQQPYIPDFGDAVEAETAVNVRVTKSNGPITRTVIDPNLNAIRVRLAIPALQESHSNGSVTGSSVSYKISLKTGVGSFVDKVNETKSGKTSTQYEIEYRIPLETTGPWDVRVERTSDDSKSDRIVNAIIGRLSWKLSNKNCGTPTAP